MSIKRQVTITCDGVCGTAISQATIPGDWQYLRLHSPHLEKKNDEVYVNQVAHLCPKCWKLVRYTLEKTLHIALSAAKKEDQP
jgi:hypothetical protein